MTILFMINPSLIQTMFAPKENNLPNNDIETLSKEKIKQIDEKQVFSFKYTGQHGDVITSYWPSLKKAMKAKKVLEEQGYDVSKISSK